MFRTLRRTTAPLSAAVLLSLAACGGGQATAPKPTVAATVAATVAPAATVAATVAPAATIAATVAPAATAAATAAAAATEAPAEANTTAEAPATTAEAIPAEPVVIGDLVTYKDKADLFQIDAPQNWTLEDVSTTDTLRLIWSAPSKTAALIVEIFSDTKTNTPEDLTSLLQKYVDKNFSSEPDFAVNSPKTQTDGSVLITWAFTDKGTQTKLLGNAFIEQRGTKVSVLSYFMPSDQFEGFKDQTSKILNSYKITP